MLILCYYIHVMLSGVCTQERDNNMKRKLSILSAVICVLGLMLTGCAKETEKADNGTSGYYNSSLPETFSYDVTIEQIGEDIDQYIDEHDMGIKRDTEEYAEFLNEFCFSDFSDLTDTTKRFYEAYASVYLSDPTVKSTDDTFADRTIGEIRGENQETSNKILEEAEKKKL